MNVKQWLKCTSPKPMWLYLYKQGENRNKQLGRAADGCLRRIWHLLTDERCRQAIELSERWADGTAAAGDADVAWNLGLDGWGAQAEAAAEGDFGTPLLRAISAAGLAAYHNSQGDWQCFDNAACAVASFTANEEDPAWAAARDQEALMQAHLIRCTVGNPFRPVTIDPAWLIPTVARRAAAAYEKRSLPSGELDPTRLAALADVLEGAGCRDAAILRHLRGPGPHVRGCWPVDLVLQQRRRRGRPRAVKLPRVTKLGDQPAPSWEFAKPRLLGLRDGEYLSFAVADDSWLIVLHVGAYGYLATACGVGEVDCHVLVQRELGDEPVTAVGGGGTNTYPRYVFVSASLLLKAAEAYYFTGTRDTTCEWVLDCNAVCE
jgi:hypothetical protein